MPCGWIFTYIIGNCRSTNKIMVVHWHLTFLPWGQFCFLMHLHGKIFRISNFSSGASGPILHKFHMETFDLFTTRSSLRPYAFVWENPLKILFSKTRDALWLNLYIYHRKLEVYQWNNGRTLTFDLFTVRSILLPYAFVWENIRISNDFFSGDSGPILHKFHMETFDLFTARSSLRPYAFVWENPLKILFSKTEDALWLNLYIYHRKLEVYQSC